MTTPIDIAALQQRRNSVLAELSSIGDMRPGSLVHRYMKCGSPACRCRQQGNPGHGPYYLLVRNVDGKRTSRSIPADTAATVQAQLDEYHRFRRLTAELLEISEQLADARLPRKGSGTPGTGKKKPARSSSPPPSKPNSPAS